MKKKFRAETVIVGTGPGGATIGRELAQRGEDVMFLEKGANHTMSVGSPLAYATMYDIIKTSGGMIIRRGITAGGSTMIYSGNAYDPPGFLKDELGIDLSPEVAETKKELNIHPLPPSFYENYSGTMKLAAAADELGHEMKPQERFIDSDLCDPRCDHCFFGCKRNAKWTARSYVEDALRQSARFYTGCDVTRVLSSGNAATGVEVKGRTGSFVVEAGRVILAAGGIGTPIILQNSGIKEAGKNFFSDPMSVMIGVMKEGSGTFREMTFTFADESREGDFVIGNVGALNGYIAQIAALNIPFLRHGIHMSRLAGMFVKLCDEPSGEVTPRGKVIKKFTDRDNDVMDHGVAIAREIMTRAGVDPETISVARGIGGHPGGTAAMGQVVDRNFQTNINNLYVCDNSVMPRSGGVPPVLTLIALAKRVSRTVFT